MHNEKSANGFARDKNPIKTLEDENRQTRNEGGTRVSKFSKSNFPCERRSWKTNEAPKIPRANAGGVSAQKATTAGEITFLIKSSPRRQQQQRKSAKQIMSELLWANARERTVEFVDPQAKKGHKKYVIYGRRMGKMCVRAAQERCTFAEKGWLLFYFIHTYKPSHLYVRRGFICTQHKTQCDVVGYMKGKKRSLCIGDECAFFTSHRLTRRRRRSQQSAEK